MINLNITLLAIPTAALPASGYTGVISAHSTEWHPMFGYSKFICI